MHYLTFMVITARNFAPLSGTVFVVVRTGDTRAQGVFKTKSAADKLCNIVRNCGTYCEVRVGHFNSDGNVETI